MYSIEEFEKTISNAKAEGDSYIWSGDIARNSYLRECLAYAVENGLATTKEKIMEQETGLIIKWL